MILFYREIIAFARKYVPKLEPLSRLYPCTVHLVGLANPPMLTRVEAQEHNSLVGQLLIASPRMTSPIFSKTVIIIVRHERKGAMGIIINRPIGDRSLASLLGP